jgi:hypothetical protein
LCAGAALFYGIRITELQVLGIHDAEHRYQAVGTFIGHELPPNAVVLTLIQSGSIRMYGGRATVRWDWLPGDRLDDAITVLSAHGYEPYILLEDWEEPQFRQRFAAANVFGRVEWRPAIEYHGEPRVRVYAVADRATYLTGASAPPHVIPSPD